jgi:hypothetical protein
VNKYNSIIAKLFQPLPWKGDWAVTIGQTSYFSCCEDKVYFQWHKHEDKHKEQWAKDGTLRFIIRYIWQNFTKGYLNIDYEIEARKAEVS